MATRAKGALDDFGTGYSSLAAISRLPVDIVKIDQSLTARLGQRDGDALATTVVTLADELGLVVIAEGIETASHARALADLGCPFARARDADVRPPRRLARLPRPFGQAPRLTRVR